MDSSDDTSVSVDAQRVLLDDAVELTRELIRVDTTNPPGRETAAAQLLADWLRERGVEARMVGPDPDRMGVVAEVRGTGNAPSLAFSGHLDVVTVDESEWSCDPFGGETYGSLLFGRGAVDMKGQVAARAAALAHLAQVAPPPGDVRLFAVADEEGHQQGASMQWLVEECPEFAVDCALEEGGGERIELGAGRAMVTCAVAERVSAEVVVTASAAGGHGSTAPASANALGAIAEVIQRLLAEHANLGSDPTADGRLLTAAATVADADARAHLEALARGMTLMPTTVTGSPLPNVVPGTATVGIDCRLPPGSGRAQLHAELSRILDGLDVEYDLVYETPLGGTGSRPDGVFFDACTDALAALDPEAEIVPVTFPGFTNAHFLRSAWGTTTYGLCPVRYTPIGDYWSGVHAANERVDVRDLGHWAAWHVEVAQRMG